MPKGIGRLQQTPFEKAMNRFFAYAEHLSDPGHRIQQSILPQAITAKRTVITHWLPFGNDPRCDMAATHQRDLSPG
jgi:hypothetical protein